VVEQFSLQVHHGPWRASWPISLNCPAALSCIPALCSSCATKVL